MSGPVVSAFEKTGSVGLGAFSLKRISQFLMCKRGRVLINKTMVKLRGGCDSANSQGFQSIE